MEPIDFEWTKKNFPSTVAAFGERALQQQTKVFNEQLAGLNPSDHETYLIAIRMARAGIPHPHHAILNILSLLQEPLDENPYVARFSASLLLLEHRLTQLAAHGVSLSEYRNMITAPHSFDSLIAEVDVLGCLLDRGGSVAIHALTGKATPKNYDVDWAHGESVVRGDVKYFRDWLRKADGDVLGTLKMLVSPDLTCGITVRMTMEQLTENMLADVALEVLELYRYATGSVPAPRHISVIDGGNGRKGACRQMPFDDWYVREIDLMPGMRPESIIVIESGVGDGSVDENSVRRNLLSAATQVPVATNERELSAIFIGSAIPNSVSDVRAVLFGRERFDATTGSSTEEPGLFSSGTPETDLKNIQAVVFFSFVYAENNEAPDKPKVQRIAKAFSREGTLSTHQAALLKDVEDALTRDTILKVPAKNG